jgi:hypothetical protein
MRGSSALTPTQIVVVLVLSLASLADDNDVAGTINYRCSRILVL